MVALENRCELYAALSDPSHEYWIERPEHVLPENPSQSWINTIPALEWPKLTYRLGNLTLLEAKPNRTIGNDLFEDKNSAYRSSRYLMTQQIPQVARRIPCLLSTTWRLGPDQLTI